ncbi:Zinc finger MYM-type protein 1 [Frankliniella fusca]|uniref:Zinc finger MYM-type protein 1 n=1 Tax=Frankliniella fusca TaxID=407009 RepID=A0AAE1HLW0_9NEOP|nr:Zinc finger MYM-type protein 1 [Frankliniella fusca]
MRVLAQQGLALRGQDKEDGNLWAILRERQNEIPELGAWLERRSNYLSPTIQNELIEIMSHMVLRELISVIKEAPFYSLIADGTTDITGEEQFSVCVRVSLNEAIKAVLLRCTIWLDNLRGCCFDGASNMSGGQKGVQRLLCDEQPKSIYVHCSNHSLDLVLQDVAKKVPDMCDILGMVRGVSKIILQSAKRMHIFRDVVLPPCNEMDESSLPFTPKLIPLCPTRWCVRANALRRFEENYARVEATLKSIVDDKNVAVSDSRRSDMRGWLKKLAMQRQCFTYKHPLRFLVLVSNLHEHDRAQS